MIVDECDPAVGTIYGVHDNPNFVVTNTEYYPAFLCGLVRRVLDLYRAFGDRIAFLTSWAFYMEGKRFFEGNRTLVTNDNLEKPILNGLRLLGRLADTRLGVESTGRRDAARRSTGPARRPRSTRSPPGLPGGSPCWRGIGPTPGGPRAARESRSALEALPFPGPVAVRHWRLDGDHSNAYAEWERQGRPEDPGPAQLARLHESGRLSSSGRPPWSRSAQGDRSKLEFSLPMFGLSLLGDHRGRLRGRAAGQPVADGRLRPEPDRNRGLRPPGWTDR